MGSAFPFSHIVKSSTIALLEAESNDRVRRGICGMISSIALIELPKGQWNEVKQVILQVASVPLPHALGVFKFQLPNPGERHPAALLARRLCHQPLLR